MIILSGIYLLDFHPSGRSIFRHRLQVGRSSILQRYQPVRPIVAVFLAFSAEWCTSCKVNEKTVLEYRAEIRSLYSKEKGVRRMKADLTVSNPEAMEWLYRFGRAGVPLYLLYIPGEERLKILPEVLYLRLFWKSFYRICPISESTFPLTERFHREYSVRGIKGSGELSCSQKNQSTGFLDREYRPYPVHPFQALPIPYRDSE